MMMTPAKKVNWTEQYKRYKAQRAEDFARTMMSAPDKATLYRAVPHPGLVLIMGDRRQGKTGLAHEVANQYHERKGLGAVLHLPTYVPAAKRKEIQKLLPGWMKVVTMISEWPTNSVVIFDEAAQSAHARRTQQTSAVRLDNLISISGQRDQLILAISHHSRKLDPNLVTEVSRVIYKQPTMAHALFERDEMVDFTFKAVDYFRGINGERARKKSNLVINFKDFRFMEFRNQLAPWWSERLSKLFAEIEMIGESDSK